jgi:serine-protein kinase ATM
LQNERSLKILFQLHTQPSNARRYNLLTLLFIIEQYWSLMHHLQGRFRRYLRWWCCPTFLNFAAIAYAEGFATARMSLPNKSMLTSAIWDQSGFIPSEEPMSLQSLNQTDLSRILLTSHHVLLEIETFAKDMDVQGPAYPYDSVCMFLSQCLSIASQDVWLYRMQPEDKVLSWLIDHWKISGTERTKSLFTWCQGQFLSCSRLFVSKRVDLPAHLSLPTCQIVDSDKRP